MNIFIKCYLEEFIKLPRNTLHDRRNRRNMVDYISTLIEGCRRGENSDVQTTIRDAVMSLVRFHEESRLSNGQVCMMGKYHNILYVALRLCYIWQLNDTGTVITLLEHIYQCEKTFERLFVGGIFGIRAPHYIAGWKSDFDDQEENIRAIVYFIDHATIGNLQLDNDIRFIDLPIENCGKATPLKICLQLNLPDKVHILLRYGASLEDHTNLIEIVLKKLMEYCHVYPFNIVNCLQFLLSVVPTIEIDLDNYDNQRMVISDKYYDLINDGLIPLSRCGVTPPELKHLCRCNIRKTLWKNYNLPHGIRELKIPIQLRRYIDLMED